MSLITIKATLEYRVVTASSFAFAITAARTDHQAVVDETLATDPNRQAEVATEPSGAHRLVRVEAPPGTMSIRYEAGVTIDPQWDDPSELREVPFGEVPLAILGYLNPSRYCESDKLVTFAEREFGAIPPGYGRVRAVSDWVGRNLAYRAGVTDGSSSTADVLLQRAGVCRDFAHVAISLLRALGIPARYVSGYGIGVEPQDFHGFFEAYLDDDWYLFDPTGMAPKDGLVRIAVGRDAADTAFATFVGHAELTDKTVSVTRVEGTDVAGSPGGPTSTA